MCAKIISPVWGLTHDSMWMFRYASIPNLKAIGSFPRCSVAIRMGGGVHNSFLYSHFLFGTPATAWSPGVAFLSDRFSCSGLLLMP